MDFDFSSEQYQLRDSVRRFLSDRWGPKQVRAAGGKFSPTLWDGLCELGLPTLLIPESEGGAGLGYVDLVLLLEEFGSALLPGPLVDSIVASDIVARFGSAGQRMAMLPEMASGSCRVAFAHFEPAGFNGDEGPVAAVNASGQWRLDGRKIVVAAADSSTHLFVSGKGRDGTAGLFVSRADAPGVEIVRHRAFDADGMLCEVRLHDAPAEPLGGACVPEALTRILETSTLAAAAQMVGVATAALEMAVAYSKERTQFDRPIGSFQAIKHKCADMFVAIEAARPSTYYAAWAADDDEAALPLAVSVAKAACGDACRLACNDALQIHGGVGFTWEFDVHLYLKRGKFLEQAYGDSSFHRERVARLALQLS